MTRRSCSRRSCAIPWSPRWTHQPRGPARDHTTRPPPQARRSPHADSDHPGSEPTSGRVTMEPAGRQERGVAQPAAGRERQPGTRPHRCRATAHQGSPARWLSAAAARRRSPTPQQRARSSASTPPPPLQRAQRGTARCPERPGNADTTPPSPAPGTPPAPETAAHTAPPTPAHPPLATVPRPQNPAPPAHRSRPRPPLLRAHPARAARRGGQLAASTCCPQNAR